jgi:hypothetical protein
MGCCSVNPPVPPDTAGRSDFREDDWNLAALAPRVHVVPAAVVVAPHREIRSGGRSSDPPTTLMCSSGTTEPVRRGRSRHENPIGSPAAGRPDCDRSPGCPSPCRAPLPTRAPTCASATVSSGSRHPTSLRSPARVHHARFARQRRRCGQPRCAEDDGTRVESGGTAVYVVVAPPTDAKRLQPGARRRTAGRPLPARGLGWDRRGWNDPLNAAEVGWTSGRVLGEHGTVGRMSVARSADPRRVVEDLGGRLPPTREAGPARPPSPGTGIALRGWRSTTVRMPVRVSSPAPSGAGSPQRGRRRPGPNRAFGTAATTAGMAATGHPALVGLESVAVQDGLSVLSKPELPSQRQRFEGRHLARRAGSAIPALNPGAVCRTRSPVPRSPPRDPPGRAASARLRANIGIGGTRAAACFLSCSGDSTACRRAGFDGVEQDQRRPRRLFECVDGCKSPRVAGAAPEPAMHQEQRGWRWWRRIWVGCWHEGPQSGRWMSLPTGR